ncbi:hypothetical protein BDB00DRAFT_807941, partial [Zychaea mexicana]|uniref:uncharacterized protein n=1 Tax=Zychaea mexicana TaxID=64656 RepID=UPI0022FECD5C
MRSCTLRRCRRLFVSGAVHGTVFTEEALFCEQSMTEVGVTDKVDNSLSVNVENTFHPAASLQSFTQQDKQRVYIA